MNMQQKDKIEGTPEPLLEFKLNGSSSSKKSGLRGERIAIIILSIVIVLLVGIIAFLLFGTSSSTSSYTPRKSSTGSYKKSNTTKSTVTTTKAKNVNKEDSASDMSPVIVDDYFVNSEKGQENQNQENKNQENKIQENQNQDQENQNQENQENQNQENQDHQENHESHDTDHHHDDRPFTERVIGTWNLVSSENFEELMQKLGVGFIKRKIGAKLKPTVIISRNEKGVWSILTKSPAKTLEIKFEIDKPFEEETLDERKVTTTVTIEDDKLVQTQRDNGGNVVCTISREVSENDELVTIATVEDVVSTRIYERKA